MVLSKSRLMAWRQCPKRLWLDLHRPELRETSAAARAAQDAGRALGAVARRLYDPTGSGREVPVQSLGPAEAVATTQALLGEALPVFEAGFSADGVRVFADVLLPVSCAAGGRPDGWRMVEVKSSTEVKDSHRDDAAVQARVARRAGLPLAAVAVAHVDGSWVYPGGGDYRGLLVEEDVSAEVFARDAEVQDWVRQAQAVAAQSEAPSRRTGRHCEAPQPCGFLAHCRASEPAAEFPLSWLPGRATRALQDWIDAAAGAEATEGAQGAGGGAGTAPDLRDVPEALLNELQQRVRRHTLAGTVYFDREGAQQALAPHPPPALFLDFETVQFTVPVWPGTRPYQQIPFQFSVHRLGADGTLTQDGFLDLSGADPSRRFAVALIEACAAPGPIFVYNAAFERSRMQELAARFADLAAPLEGLCERLADLLPVVRQHYYHPAQQGSWSIKKVLPAVCPELDYALLEGVQDGGMAMDAYKEAIDPATAPARRDDIARQLRAYCALDTLAMVRLWAFLSGRPAVAGGGEGTAGDVQPRTDHRRGAGLAEHPGGLS
jgi:hypothetical protein